MIVQGDVISYQDMCAEERASLQRGMNFRMNGEYSVLLMSRRSNAPYRDRVEEDGKVLVYEGHDVPRSSDQPSPKLLDQPERYPSGRLAQNGLFMAAARAYEEGTSPPEPVRVYEKLHQGVWVYNGLFALVAGRLEQAGIRRVFKFRLELRDEIQPDGGQAELAAFSGEQRRMIPSDVKLEVWTRDGGRCVTCGASDNLHFDHVIPFSRGGSSLVAENVQILCARHNLQKHDRIE